MVRAFPPPVGWRWMVSNEQALFRWTFEYVSAPSLGNGFASPTDSSQLAVIELKKEDMGLILSRSCRGNIDIMVCLPISICLEHLQGVRFDIDKVDQGRQEGAYLSDIMDLQGPLQETFHGGLESFEGGSHVSASLAESVYCIERLEDLLEFNEVLWPRDGGHEVGGFAFA